MKKTIDHSSSSSMASSLFEDAPGDNDSFYRSLLRQHHSMLFMDDTTSKENGGEGETCELEITSSDCSQSQNDMILSKPRSLRESKVSSGRSSPPSLYPRLVDGSFDCDGADNDPINDRCTTVFVADNTDTAPVLSRASSFYKEALKEAARIEEYDDGMPLEIQNLANKSATPEGAVSCSNISETNEKLSALSSSISSFYCAALEDAALVEEEEVLMLQHHERVHSEQHTMESAHASTSSFYRSALEALISSEQEPKLRGEAGDYGEDPISPEGLYNADFQNEEQEIDSSANFNSAGVDLLGGRQAKTCSFSLSSDTSASTSVASPTVLSRASTNESNLSQVQKRLSDVSFSSPSVLKSEPVSIAPNRKPRSFLDDSFTHSVTRSSPMPDMTGLHLSSTPNEAGRIATRSKGDSFTGKENTVCDSSDVNCSEAISGEFEDAEDDEDLRLAIYLSRVESSTESSLNSEPTFSGRHSAKGSYVLPEEDSKNDQYSAQSLASATVTESENEFLMSQIRAMEQYQRNNSTKGSLSAHNTSETGCSTKSNSDENNSRVASYSPSSSRGKGRTRRRSLLETRGETETRQAISNGNSHVVKCKGCNGRLQAPVHYSLVFCPKCQTVSPA